MQCTGEVLEAYYVNLIRTHSKNKYKLARSASPISLSDDDMDSIRSSSPRLPAADDAYMAEPGPSRPSISPEPKHASVEPSTVLINKATLSPKASSGPTLEQNMAFAALQEPRTRAAERVVAKAPLTGGDTDAVVKAGKRSMEEDTISVNNTRPRVRPRRHTNQEDID